MQEKQTDSIVYKAAQDTADRPKVIKAAKIVPSQKIKSEEGAIIPKEATQMIKLQPATPVPQPSFFESYGLYMAIIGVLLVVFFWLRLKRKRSKK